MKSPHYPKRIILALACWSGLSLASQAAAPQPHKITADQLIPKPASMETAQGEFLIQKNTQITYSSAKSKSAAILLQQKIQESLNLKLKLTQLTPANQGGSSPKNNLILLREVPKQPDTSKEAYHLKITSNTLVLEASESQGFINGALTLHQLLPVNGKESKTSKPKSFPLPCLNITDTPRFPWRGLMLDCSRTFQSIDYLKKTIDRMAYYKLNVLHLHLTDDQGWRVEIKAYPELTKKGARFPKKWNEPDAHQGYYSQKELKDLVAYATARNITIVPEIEIPGHTLAVLACYPQLSCAGGPFEIHPFTKGPGIHNDIFCAGNDEVFTFLDQVIKEICEIFPSQYIHIGGDEAPKDEWKKCEKCQARMKKENLADEAHLQSWFISQASAMLKKHGRKLIGWDEILDGGLPPRAAVMSWRGVNGGIAAAKAGHPVVMSPTSHCYFDYSYKSIDTRRAYSFNPIKGLDETQAKFVIGIQANFWSHLDREPNKVDAQLFPRLLATAERAWSPAETTDWNDFARRIKNHIIRLDEMGVNYHRNPR